MSAFFVCDINMGYVGRFAPSPSGPLHFGSLVAAVGSYLDAKSHQGEWLLRIEDIDPPREVPGATDQILSTLDQFGFQWDRTVLYQSTRQEAYDNALKKLANSGHTYRCSCSRKQISEQGAAGLEGIIYPGTCRKETIEQSPIKARTIRLLTNNLPIQFTDRICGPQKQSLNQDIGDFVVRRADSFVAYQIAVVVDDAFQNITHVVRGADLLTSTPRQIYLQSLLHLATPTYAHLPLVFNSQGKKLSKQDLAKPLDPSKPVESLVSALQFLKQTLPNSTAMGLDEFWEFAIENWSSMRID